MNRCEFSRLSTTGSEAAWLLKNMLINHVKYLEEISEKEVSFSEEQIAALKSCVAVFDGYSGLQKLENMLLQIECK